MKVSLPPARRKNQPISPEVGGPPWLAWQADARAFVLGDLAEIDERVKGEILVGDFGEVDIAVAPEAVGITAESGSTLTARRRNRRPNVW